MDPHARAAKIYDFADRVMQQGLRLAVTESMDSGQVIGLAKRFDDESDNLNINFFIVAANIINFSTLPFV